MKVVVRSARSLHIKKCREGAKQGISKGSDEETPKLGACRARSSHIKKCREGVKQGTSKGNDEEVQK